MTIGAKPMTEDLYSRILEKALGRFRFVDFMRPGKGEGRAIWRHDVDLSPLRAASMARLEVRFGVRADYFFLLSSDFYNALEPACTDLIREVAGLGHRVGLHFAPPRGDARAALRAQRDALSLLVGSPVHSFSLHNPTTLDASAWQDDLIEGMVNASAPSWRSSFTYCSDSNGTWRFQSLEEVVNDPSIVNLHALTHPEWWPPVAMRPREIVERIVRERASATLKGYDLLLKTHGRPNLGASERSSA